MGQKVLDYVTLIKKLKNLPITHITKMILTVLAIIMF